MALFDGFGQMDVVQLKSACDVIVDVANGALSLSSSGSPMQELCQAMRAVCSSKTDILDGLSVSTYAMIKDERLAFLQMVYARDFIEAVFGVQHLLQEHAGRNGSEDYAMTVGLIFMMTSFAGGPSSQHGSAQLQEADQSIALLTPIWPEIVRYGHHLCPLNVITLLYANGLATREASIIARDPTAAYAAMSDYISVIDTAGLPQESRVQVLALNAYIHMWADRRGMQLETRPHALSKCFDIVNESVEDVTMLNRLLRHGDAPVYWLLCETSGTSGLSSLSCEVVYAWLMTQNQSDRGISILVSRHALRQEDASLAAHFWDLLATPIDALVNTCMDAGDGQIDDALWQQLLSLFTRVDTSQSIAFCQTMMTGLQLLLAKVEVLASCSIFEQMIAVLQTPVVREALKNKERNEVNAFANIIEALLRSIDLFLQNGNSAKVSDDFLQRMKRHNTLLNGMSKSLSPILNDVANVPADLPIFELFVRLSEPGKHAAKIESLLLLLLSIVEARGMSQETVHHIILELIDKHISSLADSAPAAALLAARYVRRSSSAFAEDAKHRELQKKCGSSVGSEAVHIIGCQRP